MRLGAGATAVYCPSATNYSQLVCVSVTHNTVMSIQYYQEIEKDLFLVNFVLFVKLARGKSR